MSTKDLNQKAQELKALHQPGRPVILANVYDVVTANTVGSLPSCKAIATASWAVAAASGTDDDAMTLETNLQAVRAIGKVAAELGKPLTVDLQDGYGPRLEQAVAGVIEHGGVGINLEDCDKETHRMYSLANAVDRIQRALAVAQAQGVPDFVVNARCDLLLSGTGNLDETIQRGKAYLAAGATSVFVIGGSTRGGLSRDEVIALAQGLEGRLNVSCVMAPQHLTSREIGEMGVSRISIGPQLQMKLVQVAKEEAERLLSLA